MKTLIFQKLKTSTGAMFGVDARIALMTFGILSVITGVMVTTNLSKIQAQALADEMAKFTASIEGIHHDIKGDIHTALIEPSDENAMMALFDPQVLKAGKARSRWLGPYIKYDTTFHPKFGNMAITKREKDHQNECSSRALCFLWISFDHVSTKVVEHLNNIYDGENEEFPSSNGRIQWEDGTEHQFSKVYHRVAKSLK